MSDQAKKETERKEESMSERLKLSGDGKAGAGFFGRSESAGYVLVVAEKPSVGRSIAQVLGANNRKDGYLEGNGYTVTWCIGHLVEPLDPEGYDERYKRWRYEDLPIIPGQMEDTFGVPVKKGTLVMSGAIKWSGRRVSGTL